MLPSSPVKVTGVEDLLRLCAISLLSLTTWGCETCHYREVLLRGVGATMAKRSMSRIDKFLVSGDWESYFSRVTQSTLLRQVLDHFPILLDGGGIRSGPSPFRFENMWMKAEGFKDLLKGWWQGLSLKGSASFIQAEKLKGLKGELKVWNKEVFGNVGNRKAEALHRVGCWDNVEKDWELSL